MIQNNLVFIFWCTWNCCGTLLLDQPSLDSHMQGTVSLEEEFFIYEMQIYPTHATHKRGWFLDVCMERLKPSYIGDPSPPKCMCQFRRSEHPSAHKK